MLGNVIPIPWVSSKTSTPAPYSPNEFVLKIQTDLAGGLTNDNQFQLRRQQYRTDPTIPIVINYTVDWGDGNIQTNITDTVTHTYDAIGTYTIKISGLYHGCEYYGGNGNDAYKIKEVVQWGTDTVWFRMYQAFRHARNMDITATDAPDLSQCDSLGYCFKYVSSNMVNANGSMLTWDTSTVKSFNGTFHGATGINIDIPGNWDFSNAEDIAYMFNAAWNMDQDIGQMNITSKLESANTFMGDNSPTGWKMTQYDLSNWDTSGLNRFRDWSGETSGVLPDADKMPLNPGMDQWDLSNFANYPGNALDLHGAFCNCKESASTTFADIISGWQPYLALVDKIDFALMFRMNRMNESLDSWPMDHGVNFRYMFERNPDYNQSLANWNLSSIPAQSFVDYAGYEDMFYLASSFNQSLEYLNLGAPNSTSWGYLMLDRIGSGTAMTTANYDASLIAWNNQCIALGVNAPNADINNSSNLKYTIGSAAETARTNLISTYGWNINDGGGV